MWAQLVVDFITSTYILDETGFVELYRVAEQLIREKKMRREWTAGPVIFYWHVRRTALEEALTAMAPWLQPAHWTATDWRTGDGWARRALQK